MSTKSSIAVWSLVILVASMLLAPNSLFSWESPENIDNFGGGYYLPTSKALTSFIYVKSWKVHFSLPQNPTTPKPHMRSRDFSLLFLYIYLIAGEDPQGGCGLCSWVTRPFFSFLEMS